MNDEITIKNIIDNNKNDKQCKHSEDFSQNSFWYYTNEAIVQEIHKSKQFLVSNIETMNDRDEAKLHNSNGKYNFALCFCNSKEEIPMWYIYGGIFGTGMAIGITPRRMLDFLSSIKSIFPAVKVKNKWEKVSDIEMKLNDDFDVKYDWVYYFHRVKDGRQISYNNTTYDYYFDDKEFEEICFTKKYEWSYEKEFRILITLNKNGIRKISNYDKIFLEVPNAIVSQFRYKFAPESKYKDFLTDVNFQKKYQDILEDIKSLKSKQKQEKLILSRILKSKLGIVMSLLSRNKEEIKKYYLENPEEIDEEVILAYCNKHKDRITKK